MTNSSQVIETYRSDNRDIKKVIDYIDLAMKELGRTPDGLFQHVLYITI